MTAYNGQLVRDRLTEPWPVAMMGYKIEKQGLIMRVCSYCPDQLKAKTWCREQKLPFTDSICTRCRFIQLEQLTP